MIALITEEGAAGGLLNTVIGTAAAIVPEVHTANEMIGCITGKNFGSPSPMLALNDALAVALPDVKRVVLPWDGQPDISVFDPMDEPLLLVAHSFGGDTAVSIAGVWATREIHLILIDPVRHGMAGEFWAQFGARPFHVPEFVQGCTCYLRDSMVAIPPWHSQVYQDEAGSGDGNVIVPHSDHNSIVGTVTPLIIARAQQIFQQ